MWYMLVVFSLVNYITGWCFWSILDTLSHFQVVNFCIFIKSYPCVGNAFLTITINTHKLCVFITFMDAISCVKPSV